MLNDPNIVITIQPKGADKISEFLAKVGRIKAKARQLEGLLFRRRGQAGGLRTTRFVRQISS